MKVFLDTNVLIAAMVQSHESHDRSFSALERVQGKKDEGFISGHSLAEIYAVLTKAPQPFRHLPGQALLSIEENVIKYFQISVLSGAEYVTLMRDAALRGIQGGTIYDVVLLRCALKSRAEKIYTLNVRHFQNIAPEKTAALITIP